VHLGLFTHSDLRLLIGTIVAAEVSITGGFFARDLWVFTDWPTTNTPKWIKFLQYQAKSFVSTLGILTVTVNVLTPQVGISHYIATPIGVAAAFAWNWLWESSIIWRKREQG
jgi:putative flippase GtrA